MDEQINDLINREMRNLFGGCDPFNDDIIRLKAKKEKGAVYVYAVGKWRPMAYHPGRKIPSKRWQQQNMVRILRLNCGEIRANEHKLIEFVWEEHDG